MKIQFIPGSEQVQEITEAPVPSKYCIPDWYKTIAPNRAEPNIKACSPFLDSLTHGYIQRTWTDISVDETADGFQISAPHLIKMVDFREPNHLPEIDGYLHYQFLWNSIWSPIFPSGFSGLVTHPLNRIDLPFYTFSGIIDYDEFRHVPFGNLPFYIKKGFTGVIPKGTPMYQLIPLAREDWEASLGKHDADFWSEKVAERAQIPNWYKKKIWKKKEFQVDAK
jgi:hypothetical protein